MTLLFSFVHFSILKYCTTHSTGHGGADTCGAMLALPVDCDTAVGVGCTYVGTEIAVVDFMGMMREHRQFWHKSSEACVSTVF